GESVERRDNRQATDEFRNHSEPEQVFRLEMTDQFLPRGLFHRERGASKAHHFIAESLLNDLIQPNKRTAADEQNFLSVDLNVFLVRMLASALWRNVACRSFKNFQQR